MEDGHKSLFDIIEERNEADQGPFTASTKESVIMWGARALHYLYKETHITHGDIKSVNILEVGEFENM